MEETAFTTAFTILPEVLLHLFSCESCRHLHQAGARYVLTRCRFPGGRVREDPDHCFILAEAGHVPPWEPESRKHQKESMEKSKAMLAEIRAAKEQ